MSFNVIQKYFKKVACQNKMSKTSPIAALTLGLLFGGLVGTLLGYLLLVVGAPLGVGMGIGICSGILWAVGTSEWFNQNKRNKSPPFE